MKTNLLTGECRVRTYPQNLRGLDRNSAITRVYTISVQGARVAKGRAVIVDVRNADITVAIDPRMLRYDFRRFRFVESLPPGHPNLATTTYRPIEAKPLRQFVAEQPGKVLFAANGQTDSLWTPNGVVVVNGNVIKRTAPGIWANEVIPLQGNFPFFVFDTDKIGINIVSFKNGEAESEILFSHGIYSPVIIANWEPVDHLIRTNFPCVAPGELLWDPTEKKAAMSAVGKIDNNHIIFLALKGDPDKKNECLVQDVVKILLGLGASEAMILGISGDVQQYLRSDHNQRWLIGRPRQGSSMSSVIERPLSNAIIIRQGFSRG